MKKTGLIALVCLLFAFGAAAQNAVSISDLPVSVKSEFMKNFANAEEGSTSWTSLGSGFSTTFKIGESDHYAEFDGNGKLVIHRFDIGHTELPAEVIAAIKKNHPAHTIEEAEKIIKDGKVTYEVELEGEPDYEIIFAADGTVLEKKKD
jgi:hypothetical protein